jgi:hypothetical protein
MHILLKTKKKTLLLCNLQVRVCSGYTLRCDFEAPLIPREILPETPFLFSIMSAHPQAERFLQFQASWFVLVCVEPCNFFDFPGSFFDF